MAALRPVTFWYRRVWDEQRRVHTYRKNHLEDGHATSVTPAPKLSSQGAPWPDQVGWGKGLWFPEHVFLDEQNRVVTS